MVSTGGWAFILTILEWAVLVVIGIVAIFLIMLRSKKPKFDTDILVLNLLWKRSGGGRFGYESEVKEHPSGRSLCTFVPTSPTREMLKKQGGLKPVTVAVDKNRRILLPRIPGAKDVVVYAPKDPVEAEDFFGKGTVFGVAFRESVSIQTLINAALGDVKDQMQAMVDVSRGLRGGELSADLLDVVKEQAKRAVIDPTSQDDDKPSAKKKSKKDSLDYS